MSDQEHEEREKELVFEYALDAPPEKVWRAISIPAFRERWLPGEDLADPEPAFTAEDEEIHFRLREKEPPFVESTVIFHISADRNGGTVLRIVHALTACQNDRQAPPAANNNGLLLMRAA
ncbi:polyketide cyclase [Nitratireductor sp. XY-223]|uniref:SRPBCC family protein n=1 Tax=Nitratireductor sp. XY-223 TaxID=2561926 RepID=UPI0010A9F186|nr:polyketide cyclase [Nitratireductor sp. XY-223]